MAIYCDYPTEDALLGDDTVEAAFNGTEEYGFVGDELVSIHVAKLVEDSLVSGEVEYVQHGTVVEDLLINDLQSIGRVATSVLVELAQLNDIVYFVQLANVAETAVLNDEVAYSQPTNEFSGNSAVLGATLVVNTITKLVETATIGDTVLSDETNLIEDALLVNDLQQIFATLGNNVAEVAVLGDLTGLEADQVSLIEESAVLGDATIYVGEVRELVEEVGYIYDVLYSPTGGTAWVTNLRNMSMSRYSDFPVSSSARVDDTMFSAGAGGVYRHDVGAPVAASIVLGKTDFGAQETKRCSDVWLAGSTEDPLDVSVRVTRNGVPEEYTYTADKRPAEDDCNMRCTLGKGMVSRYWSFTITNPGETPFELRSMRVNANATSRRV